MTRSYSFDLCAHSPLHIDIHVLTCYVGKMVEFEFFGSGNKASSHKQKVS